jgi:hypothetical protein
MAIDMIERTSEGAHAPSRLGNYQFADDNNTFRNFTGGQDFFQNEGEDWANLFGSKVFKRNKAKATQEGKDFVNALPGMKANASCDEISRSLDQLSMYIDTQVKEIAGLKSHVVEYPKARLSEARKGEGILKMKQSKMDCLAIQQKAQAEAAKAETLATLTTLSEKSIQSAKSDLLGVNQAPTTSNNKLLLYGGIGLGAILLIVLLRRK